MTTKLLWMFDLEGTLTDNSRRQHLIQGDKPDWRTYYKGLIDDPVNVAMVTLVSSLRLSDIPVAVYSTRMPNKYDMEHRWLEKVGLDELMLLMRRNTKKPGCELVRDWCLELEPQFLVDDREDNREMVKDIVPNVLSPSEINVTMELNTWLEKSQ